MRQKFKNFLYLIGPYPYSPYLLFLFFFAVQFCRLAIIITEEPRGIERFEAMLFIAAISLPPAIVYALFGFLLNRYRSWSSQSLPLYIVEVAIAQSFIFIYSPLIVPLLKDKYNYDYATLLTASPQLFIGTLILALIALALMHGAERKILNRLHSANNLVRKLKADREELINLDESIRRQTSQFLHDRVQSDLMVVGMNLKSISGSSSPENNKIIEDAIARLENSRSGDLKNLIQTLSPNFEIGGLKGALETLIEQYEANMKVSIRIDVAGRELNSLEQLGVYRICEQALLNALVHGPAKMANVALTSNLSGAIELIISDDGPGVILEETNPGVGTAIIRSWVDILKATKEIDSVPGHGYRLQVVFPK